MKYTNQELFDKVVTHLVAQGRPALDIRPGNCRYLTKEGLMCAAGCLAVEEAPDMDWLCVSGSWKTTANNYPKLLGLGNVYFINKLQEVHDFRARSSDWRQCWFSNMQNLAKIFSLDTTTLTKLATVDWYSQAI